MGLEVCVERFIMLESIASDSRRSLSTPSKASTLHIVVASNYLGETGAVPYRVSVVSPEGEMRPLLMVDREPAARPTPDALSETGR
jgi:hypothetical protein